MTDAQHIPLQPDSEPRMTCPHCERLVKRSHFYSSGKPRCVKRTWTKPRLWKLMEHLEAGRSDEWIAARMDCTPTAINLARKRHGIPPRRLQKLTARAVARMMGVACSKTVAHWIRDGYLKAQKVHGFGGQKMYAITRSSVWDFVEDERTWHLWTVEQIEDDYLRNHAAQVRGAVRFLTPGEVADRMCTTQQNVNVWIHKGYLPARKWGNWWIDERDLARFRRPRLGGRPRKAAA